MKSWHLWNSRLSPGKPTRNKKHEDSSETQNKAQKLWRERMVRPEGNAGEIGGV